MNEVYVYILYNVVDGKRQTIAAFNSKASLMKYMREYLDTLLRWSYDVLLIRGEE